MSRCSSMSFGRLVARGTKDSNPRILRTTTLRVCRPRDSIESWMEGCPMGDSLTKEGFLAGLGGLATDVTSFRRTIEAERCLPKDLVDKLRTTGCFGMTLPRGMGGSELTPIEQ